MRGDENSRKREVNIGSKSNSKSKRVQAYLIAGLSVSVARGATYLGACSQNPPLSFFSLANRYIDA